MSTYLLCNQSDNRFGEGSLAPPKSFVAARYCNGDSSPIFIMSVYYANLRFVGQIQVSEQCNIRFEKRYVLRPNQLYDNLIQID